MHSSSRTAVAAALLLAACGGGGANSADHEIPESPELAGKAVYVVDLDGL